MTTHFAAPLYPVLPRLLGTLDRMRPSHWRDWPVPAGGLPPAEVLDRFPSFKAMTHAHRMRSRVLQADAFKVTPATLDRYIADRMIADHDALGGWMRSGKGAIFACPHYGPFVGGALLFGHLASEGSPAHVFYDPSDSVPDNRRFDEFFRQFEGRINVLHNQPADLMKATRALRKKQCISIMFDVVQRATDCIYVPFFGRLYPAMGGAAVLSLLSGAPLIPAYSMPENGRKVRIVFGEPILPGNYTSPDREQNVFAMTCALFRDLERQLTVAPWHWIYWGQVAQTTPFHDSMIRDHGSVIEEISRRVRSTPALAKVAPALQNLAG